MRKKSINKFNKWGINFKKEVRKIDIELDAIIIGNRIKNKLKELNIKQIQFVEMTGISKTAISNYILGNRIPDTKSALLIANELNVSIEWILLGKETNSISLEEKTLLEKYNLLTPENKGMTKQFINERIKEQQEQKGKVTKEA